MNIPEIIKTLNDSYLYLTVMALGMGMMFIGTSRRFKVEVKDRKRLNLLGMILLIGGIVLAAIERFIK